MLRLTDTEIIQRGDLDCEIHRRREQLNAKIAEVRQAIAEALAELGDTTEHFNEIVEFGESWVNQVCNRLSHEFEAGSDDYKNSDEGKADLEWMADWMGVSLGNAAVSANTDDFDPDNLEVEYDWDIVEEFGTLTNGPIPPLPSNDETVPQPEASF